MDSHPVNWIILVLGSAGIGALVSTLMTFVSQILERRARKREILLTSAIRLAESRSKLLADHSGPGQGIPPEIAMAESYFQMLESVFDKGSFTEEQKNKLEKARKE